MRSRVPLLVAVLVLSSLALPYAAHASVPYFGPIIPSENNLCPAGWGMLIQVINNLISFLITVAIIFVAPLMIAYSGFLFVVNPFNSGGIEKAKGILTNTIVGIVIALAGYLIVDAIMAALYNPQAQGFGTAWSSIINWNGDKCLPQAGSLPTDQLNQALTGVSANGGAVSVNGQLQQCSAANTACNPASLQAAGFNATQANIMSCIAVTESSGNPSLPPYNTWHAGSNSTACGLFQITQTTWNKAASGSCSSFSSCTNAACNTQVAQTLVAKNGYSDWTCANCNAKAAACIQQYGGTTSS